MVEQAGLRPKRLRPKRLRPEEYWFKGKINFLEIFETFWIFFEDSCYISIENSNFLIYSYIR